MNHERFCSADHKKYRKLFTPEEDELITKLVGRLGTNNWNSLAGFIANRTARQIRERWYAYLSPDINRDPWSVEEDQLLLDLIINHGTKWSEFIKYFQGRTVNSMKNRYNTVIRRVRARNMDENSKEDYLKCARIGRKHTETEKSRDDRSYSPEPDSSPEHTDIKPIIDMFSICNLLNH